MTRNLLFKFNDMVKDVSQMDAEERRQLGCSKVEIIFNTYLANFGPEQGARYALLVFMYATQVVCNGNKEYIDNFSEIIDFFESESAEPLKDAVQHLKAQFVMTEYNEKGLHDLKVLVNELHNDDFNMEVYTYMMLVSHIGGNDTEADARIKDLFYSLLTMR